MAPLPQYVYVEESVLSDPRTEGLLDRLPRARVIECERYGEIFNRRAQDFRLQKDRPAWIVARKTGRWVLEAPAGYGLGGQENYYFSHMLNCLYDCGYCFLQGMFRSAHYLWFVNYDECMDAIEERLAASDQEAVWFFSGYDCDSLAAEPMTRFAEEFLPFFRERPRAWLELRTKSVRIESLLEVEPVDNCVVAFSFTPEEVHRELEGGVPSVAKRVAAADRLLARGWRVGLRFDPLIWSPDFEARYERLFKAVWEGLGDAALHSVSLGSFRLPKSFYSRMSRMKPQDPLLAGPLVESDGLVGYRPELEAAMLERVGAMLLERVPEAIFFPCHTSQSPDLL